jgi:hypothetical protein
VFFAGFGVISRVLFDALYAAFRMLLALIVTRGRGEASKDVDCSCCGMRFRCCVGRWLVLG